MHQRLTEEQYLRASYATFTVAQIAAYLGRTPGDVRRKLAQMGLKAKHTTPSGVRS